jgi:hypothetical protein
VGVKPNNGLLQQLKARGFVTYLAGDCWQGAKIAGAMEDGMRLGCMI